MNHKDRELSEIIADRDDIEDMHAAFTSHSRVIIVPRLVSEPVRRVNPALLGGKAERDAFADRMLAEERRNVAAAVSDELRTEGRVHVNTRPQRHE